MRQDAHGFTLIELMVTVAVMAVLLGIGVPSFNSLQRSVRAASTFHLLTTALATARVTAITRGVPVSVCPSDDGLRCRRDTAWEHGWIVFEDPAYTTQPTSSDAVKQRMHSLGAGFALRSTAGRTLVRFHPSGRASGSNVSIRLCAVRAGTHLGSVVVNNAGRPRAERKNNTPCPYVP